jgi:uncharacterized membrane protein HdeD (DUF308 family)
MLAVRGGLGIVLGLAVLLWPRVGLGGVVTLFGTYAVLDGIWAVAWAVRASRRPLEGWPVVLEGIVSVAIGVAALVSPFEAARVVPVIAVWGLITGMLEILAAVRLPRGLAGHWFLAAGGAWSIFLAVLILSLPYAFTDEVVKAIGVYALFFGGLVSVAASEFRIEGIAPPDDEDMGQTLAIYGAKPGPYLVLPFFPPSTVRDTVGATVDGLLDPMSLVMPLVGSVTKRVGTTVNDRSINLELYEEVEASVLDLYGATRNLYLQRRERAIGE